jgi:hypothetical protein
MVNCPQRYYTMLLSKLTPDAAKPLTRSEEGLPIGLHSATNGGLPCLSVVRYPERATG